MNDQSQEQNLLYGIAMHLLAVIIVGGLFSVIGISLMGVVNIENPTVSLLVGQVIGAIMTPVIVVVTHYFPKGKVVQIGKDDPQ